MIARIPAGPLVYGLGGLIPFFASAGLILFAPVPWSSWGLLSLTFYGVAILSFLGGIHWGIALKRAPEAPQWAWYGASVTPSLAAWLAWAWPLPPQQYLHLAACFVVWAVIETVSPLSKEFPAWFTPLRWLLTVGAAASLLAAALL